MRYLAGIEKESRIRPSEQDEEELEAIGKGDKAAFWRLWQHHSSKLYEQSLILTDGNHADAEDLLSECMLKACQRLPEYAGVIRNAEAWFTRMLQNLSIDIIRRRQKLPPIVDNDTETNPNLSPEKKMIYSERISNLLQFARDLPPKLKKPFVLYFIKGLTYQEIAHRCNITPVNVRKRIQLARSELRAFLSELESGKRKPPPPSQAGFSDLIRASRKKADKGPTTIHFNWRSVEYCRPVCYRLPCKTVVNRHIYLDRHFWGPMDPRELPRLRQYVADHPKGWKKRLKLAQLNDQLGFWADAAHHYGATWEKKAEPSIAWRHAQLLEIAGQRQQAAELLLHTGKKMEKRKRLLFLSKALRLGNQIEEAETTLREILKSHSTDYPAKHLLGVCLLSRGCYEDILELFESERQGETRHLPTLNLILEAIKGLNDDRALNDHLKYMLKIHPKNLPSLKCWLDQQAGRSEMDRFEYHGRLNWMVEQGSHSPFYLESLCFFFVASDNSQRALEVFDSFVETHPNSPAGWYRLARWQFRLNHEALARESLARANGLSIGAGMEEERAPQTRSQLEQALKTSYLAPGSLYFI